jgi:hypothetical protein
MSGIKQFMPPRQHLGRLSSLVVVLLTACASARGTACHHDDNTTTQATTQATTSPSTSGGTAGDIDDAEVAGLDRTLAGLLNDVYGGARRTGWKREDGPGSVVYTLEYSFAGTHTNATTAALQTGMAGRGFTVDRVFADEQVTTVFAARGGFPVIVTVDIGATKCVITVERAGP